MAGTEQAAILSLGHGPSVDGGDGGAGVVIRTVELTKVYAGTDFAAVDTLNLSVYGGEIFGLLGPNGAGKTTTAGMLTTRVVPTSGSAYVGAIDVVAHPALAKQLIGIVSQQNTLDRQLTVWENLYFHGRLFGISAARVPSHGRRAARAVPAREMGQGVRLRAVRRDGPAADGGPSDLPPPGGAVPRRADRGPRSAGPPRAVGDPRRAQPRGPDDPADHALHGGGRRALRPRGDHGPRQDPCAGHAGRAQAVGWGRHDRDGEGAAAPPRRSPSGYPRRSAA